MSRKVSLFLIWSLVALAIWGLWGVFANLASRHLGSYSAIVWEVIGAAIVALIILFGFLRVTDLQADFEGMTYGILTGATYTIGLLFLFLALRAAVTSGPSNGPTGHVHTILVITAMYPLLAAVLNYIILNEPLSLRQLIGMGLGVTAIVVFVSGGE